MNILEKFIASDKASHRKFKHKLMENKFVARVAEFFTYKEYHSDEAYIRYKYKKAFGVEPDLAHPQNFNEKNNWRKLYDRNPYYTRLVDKYLIKEEIENKLGSSHTFPLLGVWDRPEDIDYDKLPDQFVLKVNHAGGISLSQ